MRVTHAWGGPIDRSPDGQPLIGRLRGREHIAFGIGWSGNGVGPSALGGCMLASLALGLDNEWSASPFVRRRANGTGALRWRAVHPRRCAPQGAGGG